jgi:hypothetical protein
MIGGMSEKSTPGETESAADGPLPCLRCGGAMAQGFIMDKSHRGKEVGKWVPGAPQRSFWSVVKELPEALPIGAFRCASCGRLELFADKLFELR